MKDKKVCVHCGKSGHTVDIYYRKHGFHLDYKLNNFRNSMNSIEIIWENARDSALCNFDELNKFKLTQQQYQAFMSLIQKS